MSLPKSAKPLVNNSLIEHHEPPCFLGFPHIPMPYSYWYFWHGYSNVLKCSGRACFCCEISTPLSTRRNSKGPGQAPPFVKKPALTSPAYRAPSLLNCSCTCFLCHTCYYLIICCIVWVLSYSSHGYLLFLRKCEVETCIPHSCLLHRGS